MKGTKEVFGLTGMSIGLGMLGEGIGGNIGNNITEAGETSSKFISPMVNLSMGGFMIKQLKGLGK